MSTFNKKKRVLYTSILPNLARPGYFLKITNGSKGLKKGLEFKNRGQRFYPHFLIAFESGRVDAFQQK
jgi:predicted SPOUT superfamily RNA methylase MTH1